MQLSNFTKDADINSNWAIVNWSQPNCSETTKRRLKERPPNWIAELRAELLHTCASEHVFGSRCDQCELRNNTELRDTLVQRTSKNAFGEVTPAKVAACDSICSPNGWFNGYECVSAQLSVLRYSTSRICTIYSTLVLYWLYNIPAYKIGFLYLFC